MPRKKEDPHGVEAFSSEVKRLEDFLTSKGWIGFGRGWVDPIAFEEDGFHAPVLLTRDALAIQRHRDEEEALQRPEVQRARFLGILSARKNGPVPLEQARAGFLFLLQRRAIRLIEDE